MGSACVTGTARSISTEQRAPSSEFRLEARSSKLEAPLSAELMLAQYDKLLAARCRAWVVPGYTQQDLLQEARLVALSCLETWAPEKSALASWLVRNVERKLFALKKKAVAQAEAEEVPRNFWVALDPAPDPAEVAVANVAAAHLLATCRAHLADPRHAILLELLIEGKTQAEIAGELGITPQRVSQLVQKVRTHLEKFV